MGAGQKLCLWAGRNMGDPSPLGLGEETLLPRLKTAVATPKWDLGTLPPPGAT